MTRIATLLLAMLGVASTGCTDVKSPRGTDSAGAVITDHHQLEAAVDQTVTIVGLQTRTKLPTVCGVDVDGDYKLSDREVIVHGVLRRHIVKEADPMTANRGVGTFYAIVDPVTGELAKTTLHDR